jgi:hypothetical protein
MDSERRLELIALLAQDKTWDAVVLIGRSLLDAYYPADIFTGVSGDSGPEYVVALRKALARIDEQKAETEKSNG